MLLVALIPTAMRLASSRHHENDWEAKTLSRQRSWETLVHEKDIDQTNAVLTLNNIVSVYNNEQKFPEMDAYCISKLYADWKGLSQTAITTALSVDNILDTIDDMFVDQSGTSSHSDWSNPVCYPDGRQADSQCSRHRPPDQHFQFRRPCYS